MSRFALLGDIHANHPALESVLADIERREGIDATYHLGDLVGYGPWPNETVRLLIDKGITGVSGNYDSTVATNYHHCGCAYENPHQEELSHLSFEWTKQAVSEETRRALDALPFRIDVRPAGGHASGPTLILVHGTPTLNTLYWTEDRPDSFCSKMAGIAGARSGDVIAFGHTHKPWTRLVDGVRFVNAGSVGRPKDGDPRACYVIVDLGDEGRRVEFVRVEYDLDRAAEGIREAGLPMELAEILRSGGGVPATSAS